MKCKRKPQISINFCVIETSHKSFKSKVQYLETLKSLEKLKLKSTVERAAGYLTYIHISENFLLLILNSRFFHFSEKRTQNYTTEDENAGEKMWSKEKFHWKWKKFIDNTSQYIFCSLWEALKIPSSEKCWDWIGTNERFKCGEKLWNFPSLEVFRLEKYFSYRRAEKKHFLSFTFVSLSFEHALTPSWRVQSLQTARQRNRATQFSEQALSRIVTLLFWQTAAFLDLKNVIPLLESCKSWR